MYKILRIDFPYTENQRRFKPRPVLQLTKASGRFKILVAAYITSKEVELLESDIVVGDELEKTGLIRRSTIRLHKLTNVPLARVKGTLGELPRSRMAEVKRKLKMLFGL